MYIIHNAHINSEAIQTLQQIGICLPFDAPQIMDTPLSGHPDMFICQFNQNLIIAPNTPQYFIELLQNYNISYIFGEKEVQKNEFSPYNAVITNKYIIHHQKYTDAVILKLAKIQNYIHVNQGYTRCSLLPLQTEKFITSDQGILKKLSTSGIMITYISPKDIILPGYKNGCLGGCFGICNERIFCFGNLNKFSEGHLIKDILTSHHLKLTELCDTPLYDYGSLFFILEA